MTFYPVPDPKKRPWWASRFALFDSKTYAGYLAAFLLFSSVAYGVWRVNSPNFLPQIAARADNEKGASAAVGAAPSHDEQRTLNFHGRLKLLALVFWIVAPPIWFWFEYVGLYRYEKDATREKLGDFKYTQDVSSKVWLALVTALTILYFGKDIRGS